MLNTLLDITVIFAISVAAVLVCHRLRIPSVVGFLLAGIVAGPSVSGLVRSAEQIELISEIGVVLLLFVIGLEFSLSHLVDLRRQLFVSGSVQLLGTAAIVGIGTYLLGSTVAQSTYIGFVVALSSTAVVLKLMQDRAELESPHGRMVFGVLVFQDIAVVPIMLAAPLLAGVATVGSGAAVLTALLTVAGVLLVGFLLYRWVVPWLLYRITRTGSTEAFLLGVLGICTGIALMTQAAGLSLALGAFLAGIIISESEYSHQAVGVILPFRDVFMSLFFVSIGMLLDIGYLLDNPVRIAILTAGIIVIKPLVGTVSGLALGLPIRSAVLGGVALGQIGEFSLVAIQAAVVVGLVGSEMYQTVLDTAVASMLLAPALIAAGPRLALAAQGLPLPQRMREGRFSEVPAADHTPRDHVVIIGFGVTGRNVARTAASFDIPYAIIEMNADTVLAQRKAGDHVSYGDATNEAVLRTAGAHNARAIVVAINDSAAARRITQTARRIAPQAFLIVRTRYLKEVEALHELGADEVVADELEISIEVYSRVLARFLVPREDIKRTIGETREGWRRMGRSLSPEATVAGLRTHVPELSTHSFLLTEESPLVGRTLEQSRLREEQGVSVVAIERDGDTLTGMSGATLLRAGDTVVVVGPHDWTPAGLD